MDKEVVQSQKVGKFLTKIGEAVQKYEFESEVEVKSVTIQTENSSIVLRKDKNYPYLVREKEEK